MENFKLLAILSIASVVLFASCKKNNSVAELNVTASNGTVVKKPNQAAYDIGDIVQLTATPNSGYIFTSWSGDATGSINPLHVTMNANKNITANFGTDDTKALQALIDQCPTGGTVLIAAGIYNINAVTALKLKSDMTLKMVSGTILRAIPNSNTAYNIIKLSGVTKVNIVGGTLQGERASHTGTTGEWGMGIGIYGSSDVTVSNITAKDCWGDGFYIGANGATTSTNITLDNVISDNNRRQGLSITSADGVVVKNSVFKNTNGTAPMAGIDIEPNARGVVNNVQITNNICSGNAWPGIVAGRPTTGVITNLTVSGNEVYGNGIGLMNDVNVLNGYGLVIAQTNNTIVTTNNVHDNMWGGIGLSLNSKGNTISKNTVTNNGKSTNLHGGGIFVVSASTGNIITENTVKGNKPHNIDDSVGGNTISGNIVD